jgi:hypothetical protein
LRGQCTGADIAELRRHASRRHAGCRELLSKTIISRIDRHRPWTDSMNSEPTSGSEKKRPHVKTQVTQQQQQQQQAEQQRQYLPVTFHRHKIQAVQFARAL